MTYFTTDDPLGTRGTIHKLFWRIFDKKNKTEPGIWGSNKQIKKAKIFPRGKVYHRLQEMQFNEVHQKSIEATR